MKSWRQRNPEVSCWGTGGPDGRYHIPCVQHYSTLAPRSSCGGEGLQPFTTNRLRDFRAPPLYRLCMVRNETLVGVAGRERETRERIRGGRAVMEGSQQDLNGQPRSVFLCSPTRTRRSAPQCLLRYHGNPPSTDLLLRCSANSLSPPPPQHV